MIRRRASSSTRPRSCGACRRWSVAAPLECNVQRRLVAEKPRCHPHTPPDPPTPPPPPPLHRAQRRTRRARRGPMGQAWDLSGDQEFSLLSRLSAHHGTRAAFRLAWATGGVRLAAKPCHARGGRRWSPSVSRTAAPSHTDLDCDACFSIPFLRQEGPTRRPGPLR